MWSILIIGLFITMGFVNKQQAALCCSRLTVNVSQDGDVDFIDKDDIKQLLKDRGDSIVGQPKSTINIPELENVLNSHADIANSEVSMSIDGEVKINVKQRKPVIRVINSNGDSYYLDEQGKLMPLSDKYTAKVLVVNGNILEPFASRYKYSVTDISKDSLRKLEAGNSSATNTATEIKEPQAQVNITNTTPAESSAESKAFEGAQALLQAGKYKDAFDAFDKFLQGYANSKQVPNAQYGLGYAQFSLKNYKAAIATQQKLISQFPDSLKVPDAKFNIANCQIQLSDIEGAKKSLRDLIAQHPTSELVPNAKRRLAVLESIKK